MTFDVMMMLGVYPFMLNTAAYGRLRHTASWRWARQDRIGRKPAQQYIGPGTDNIRLDGEILPHWKGGHAQLDAMRALARRGKPLVMVDGRGHVWGEWVILKIRETDTEFFSDGTPRVIRFTLDLAEYGTDRGGIDAPTPGRAAIETIARMR